jgi:hypothetical protein
MMENKKGNAEIQIELSEEIAQGTYANLAIIAHSDSRKCQASFIRFTR